MWQLVVQIFALGGALSSIIAVIHTLRLFRWSRQLTWDDSLRTAKGLLTIILRDNWRPEVVVGLGRSGGIWGGWLAGNLDSLPFMVVDDKYDPEIRFPGGIEVLDALRKTYPDIHRILVVEGASSTGATITLFQNLFAERLNGIECRFAVLYKSPLSRARVDYVGELGPERWPTRFPWHGTDHYRPYLRDLFPISTPSRSAAVRKESNRQSP